jgi:flagellar protein FlaG
LLPQLWNEGTSVLQEEQAHIRADSFCQSLSRDLSCAWILDLLPVRKPFKLSAMNNPMQPNVKLTNDPNYRENYANSVQMRVNIWDFFLVFGTLQQQSESQVDIRNFQGIYLSPQQAKALLGLLQQNVAGYESAFGEIKLDPRMSPSGPVH